MSYHYTRLILDPQSDPPHSLTPPVNSPLTLLGYSSHILDTITLTFLLYLYFLQRNYLDHC